MNTYLRLQSEQDQDEAEALKWWRETPNDVKAGVWAIIQRTHANPLDEVVSRFAQLGFTHVALLAAEEERSR